MTCRDLNVMVFSGMSTELCHAAVPGTAGGVNHRVLSWRGKGTNLISFFQTNPLKTLNLSHNIEPVSEVDAP